MSRLTLIDDERKPTRAPEHLEAATREWYESVVADYELAEHHLRVLQLAGEAWDRGERARRTLDADGLTFVDRFGQIKERPEVIIARDCGVFFMRAIRELDLDVAPPVSAQRPPSLRSNRRL